MAPFLLKKANANFSLAIDHIIQQEAKALGIPNTELPIDEVMEILNRPANKEMLERSIAQLHAGKVVRHELIHG